MKSLLLLLLLLLLRSESFWAETTVVRGVYIDLITFTSTSNLS